LQPQPYATVHMHTSELLIQFHCVSEPLYSISSACNCDCAFCLGMAMTYLFIAAQWTRSCVRFVVVHCSRAAQCMRSACQPHRLKRAQYERVCTLASASCFCAMMEQSTTSRSLLRALDGCLKSVGLHRRTQMQYKQLIRFVCFIWFVSFVSQCFTVHLLNSFCCIVM
jgi:hypothetical protein